MAQFTLAQVKAATTPATNWSKFIAHPIADLLLWALANLRPRVHPNAVTLAAAVLAGAAAVSYAGGTYAGLVGGAALFHLSFCLDTIDGALARLHGKASVLGAWMDPLIDFSRSMVLAPAFAIGVYRMTGDVRMLYAGFAVQAVGLLYYYLAEVTQKLAGKRPAQMLTASPHPVVVWVRRIGIVPSPFGLADFEGVYLVVFPLLGYPLEGMVLAASLGLLSRAITAGVVLFRLGQRTSRA